MKNLEFMREAGKVLFNFFGEIYVSGEYSQMTVASKYHQATFQIKGDCDGLMKFYLYKTGTISYNYGSDMLAHKGRSEFQIYYEYSEDDDHKAVLKKLKKDLSLLKKVLPNVFVSSAFKDYPVNNICLKFDKAFTQSFPDYDLD